MTADNPWLGGSAVFHWAHQGGAREGPSNTLRAMRLARNEAKADGIELDVHRSKDGHLVLMHDERLDRTTNGSGKIADHTLAELRQFDAAYWWVPGTVDDHHASSEQYGLRGRVPPEVDLGVATLDDVLDAFPGLPLTIEVKDGRAVEPLVELLRSRQVATRNVVVTSFKETVVRKLRKHAPELPLAPGRVSMWWFLLRVKLRFRPRLSGYVAVQLPHRYGIEDLPPPWRWLAPLVPPRFSSIRVIDRRMVDAARQCGVPVHAWTIDDEAEMKLLVDMGVGGIMTDRPTVLTKVLVDTGKAWAPAPAPDPPTASSQTSGGSAGTPGPGR